MSFYFVLILVGDTDWEYYNHVIFEYLTTVLSSNKGFWLCRNVISRFIHDYLVITIDPKVLLAELNSQTVAPLKNEFCG